MPIIATLFGIVLIAAILWEGFETVVLPRRVTRAYRFTRLYYRIGWDVWAKMVRTIIPKRWRETWLSVFGQLSILMLLTLWAAGIILGFAILHWAAGATVPIHGNSHGFLTDLYLSATTFFTLGLGDVVPVSRVARFLVGLEAGMGFGFLALVIAYLPALNQYFTRRETDISLLDARAGSPPTATELLRRHGHARGQEELRQLLFDWERWSAEFLEGHLAYPVLAYFRSQHGNESWLAALTAILDSCALIMAGPESVCKRQAELTFAIARHAIVDICLVFRTVPRPPDRDRLPPGQLAELRAIVAAAGFQLDEGEAADQKLFELRNMYEPYLDALATHFQVMLPPFLTAQSRPDNWRGNMHLPGAARKEIRKRDKGEHF